MIDSVLPVSGANVIAGCVAATLQSDELLTARFVVTRLTRPARSRRRALTGELGRTGSSFCGRTHPERSRRCRPAAQRAEEPAPPPARHSHPAAATWPGR